MCRRPTSYNISKLHISCTNLQITFNTQERIWAHFEFLKNCEQVWINALLPISYENGGNNISFFLGFIWTVGLISTKSVMLCKTSSLYLLRISATDGGSRVGQTTVRVNILCQGNRIPVFIMNEYKANIYAASHHGSSVVKVALLIVLMWLIFYQPIYINALKTWMLLFLGMRYVLVNCNCLIIIFSINVKELKVNIRADCLTLDTIIANVWTLLLAQFEVQSL